MSEQRWHVRSQQFVLPKAGAGAEECEDALGLNDEALRYAVADGATEAFDSKSWAARLAEGWAGGEPADSSAEAFGAWVASEGRALHESWEGRALPWYAEAKARAGSFAAFVGLRFWEEAGELRAECVALGDACMIHLRGGSMHCAMPVRDSREFNSTPPLVPSQEALWESARAKLLTDSGVVRTGDVFLLLSDAAAAWFLKLLEDGSALAWQFDALLANAQTDLLTELFRVEREAGRIRDDDVAALRVSAERV